MKNQKQIDLSKHPIVIDVQEVSNILNVDVEKVHGLIDEGILKTSPDYKDRPRVTKLSLKQYLLKEIIKRVK